MSWYFLWSLYIYKHGNLVDFFGTARKKLDFKQEKGDVWHQMMDSHDLETAKIVTIRPRKQLWCKTSWESTIGNTESSEDLDIHRRMIFFLFWTPGSGRITETITTCRVHRGCLSKVIERKQPIVHDTVNQKSNNISLFSVFIVANIFDVSVSIVPILLPTYSQHIGYIFPTLSIIWCQYIPNRFPTYSPHPRQISCQVSNRYQAVRQIAKGTWSQAQPFLLSAWCFKLFQGYGKRTDITKSSEIHENHGILSLRIGDSWWFNSCFNRLYSPGFALQAFRKRRALRRKSQVLPKRSEALVSAQSGRRWYGSMEIKILRKSITVLYLY